MTLLLQISDTHFGTEQPAVVQALERLVHTLQPTGLILSGDITQRATSNQFDAARRFLDRLGIAVVMTVPGNHDIPMFSLADRLFSPYRRYFRAFGTGLEPVIDLPDCQVIGVNTTRWYRHQNGEVSPAQIERVARLLERDTQQKLRVVVVHQPVAVTRLGDRGNLLLGHEQAVDAWSQAGVDLILGGHLHLPFVIPLRGATRQAWCVQAGTAISSRTRNGAPNSLNLIHQIIDGPERRCEVVQWDFMAATGEFEQVKVHALMLSPLSPYKALQVQGEPV